MTLDKGGRVVCIGECMVEFALQGDGSYRQGFAGDTFNSAWYLRRVLPGGWAVDYVTAVGDDPMSARMRDFMVGAGIGTEHVATVPGGTPGLYVISLNGSERSFSYWRDRSAARTLAADPGRLERAFHGADALVYSGITLAILPEADRETLLAALAGARVRGSAVVFDPNLRPRLWPDADTMRTAVGRAASGADIVLPSLDDERAAFGDVAPDETAARYLALGAGLVVVKNGAEEILWREADAGGRFLPPPADQVVDTTAAGDSFNAGFLAAHLTGADRNAALSNAARTARRVIAARGALVDIRDVGPVRTDGI